MQICQAKGPWDFQFVGNRNVYHICHRLRDNHIRTSQRTRFESLTFKMKVENVDAIGLCLNRFNEVDGQTATCHACCFTREDNDNVSRLSFALKQISQNPRFIKIAVIMPMHTFDFISRFSFDRDFRLSLQFYLKWGHILTSANNRSCTVL